MKKSELTKINKLFPNLYYCKNSHSILGEINIFHKYNKKNLIVPCTNKNNCCIEVYEIQIFLEKKIGETKFFSNNTVENTKNNKKRREVFETSGKIKLTAEKLKKDKKDLHLNSDDSCCLNIFPKDKLKLSDFISEIVFPYFMWQAYLSKYEKVPPVGEYSHGEAGLEEVRKELKKEKLELLKNKKLIINHPVNQPCPCGSQKKYKKCCKNNNNDLKNSLITVENKLISIKKI